MSSGCVALSAKSFRHHGIYFSAEPWVPVGSSVIHWYGSVDTFLDLYDGLADLDERFDELLVQLADLVLAVGGNSVFGFDMSIKLDEVPVQLTAAGAAAFMRIRR